MKIELRIDRLAVDGLPPANSETALRAQIAAELSARLAHAPPSSVLRSATHRAQLAARDTSSDDSASSRTLGQQIGAALDRGIRR
jgi:hypothetical protein